MSNVGDYAKSIHFKGVIKNKSRHTKLFLIGFRMSMLTYTSKVDVTCFRPHLDPLNYKLWRAS